MSHSVPEGLCARCEHRREVTGAGGSRFVLCALSRRDDRFPRYPRLPVLECAGFAARRRTQGDPPAEEGANGVG